MSGVLCRLLALQGAITLASALGLLAWQGAETALAGMAGGSVASASAVAYGLVAWLLGRDVNTSPMRAFLFGEATRVVAAIGFLAVGIGAFPGADGLAFLGVFTAAMLAYLLVLVV